MKKNNRQMFRDFVVEVLQDPYEKLLGHTLEYYMSGDGKCYPSISTLMQASGIKNVKTLHKKIKSIESQKALFVRRKKGIHNQYEVIATHISSALKQVKTSTIERYHFDQGINEENSGKPVPSGGTGDHYRQMVLPPDGTSTTEWYQPVPSGGIEPVPPDGTLTLKEHSINTINGRFANEPCVQGGSIPNQNLEVVKTRQQPLPEKPHLANQPQQRKDNNKEKKETKTLSLFEKRDCEKKNKKSKNNYTDRFQIFWDAYRKQCDKQGCSAGAKTEAWKQWSQLSDEELTSAEKGFRAYRDRSLKSNQSMKHCCRYLSKKCWEGYETQPKEIPWWQKLTEPISVDRAQALLERFKPNGHWPEELGPSPGQKNCVFNHLIDTLEPEFHLKKFQTYGS
jgi:putative lipoic acid-binding regulatory protein